MIYEPTYIFLGTFPNAESGKKQNNIAKSFYAAYNDQTGYKDKMKAIFGNLVNFGFIAVGDGLNIKITPTINPEYE